MYEEWAPREQPILDADHIGAQAEVQVEEIRGCLIEDAQTDSKRWNELLKAVLGGPEDVEEAVLEALLKQKDAIDDADGYLWSTVRDELAHQGSEETLSTRTGLLTRLNEAFTPRDFSRRHAWRFAPFPRIPGWLSMDDEERERRIEAMRAETVHELWQRADPWDALAALVREVAPIGNGIFFLGSALGKSPHADELEPRVLAGSWADLPAKPPTRRRPGRPAAAATITAEAGGRKLQAEYNQARGTWKKRGARSLAPGLVVYARVDGSFAVWDPIRNARPAEKSQQDLSKGYHFTPSSLWYGLDAPDGITRLCRLKDLYDRYEGVCAYVSIYIDRVTGSRSVDHFIAKSSAVEHAYRWSNYRLACGKINGRKGVFGDGA